MTVMTVVDDPSHIPGDHRNPEAQRVRENTCQVCVAALEHSGNVMWAFGFAPNATRRAIAIVAQMGSALARGTVVLLKAGNGYAAAALLRQFVEVEHLLYLFATDPEEGKKWLSSSPEQLRKEFAPARMRARSNRRFQDEQYWTHCEIGGHPHPLAAFLLPEHGLLNPPPPQLASLDWLWLDLLQHMERALAFLETAPVVSDIPAVVSALLEARSSLIQWRTVEPKAGRL